MLFDDVDLALLQLMLEEPQAGTREHARLLGVARGTVQARARRLEERGVLLGYAPRLDLAQLGFTVVAFVHLHLAQGRLDVVAVSLEAVPEVLEAFTTTGEADILCRVVARDNSHLEETVQELLAIPGVVRTRTEIALNERLGYRVRPLLMSLKSAHRPRSRGEDAGVAKVER